MAGWRRLCLVIDGLAFLLPLAAPTKESLGFQVGYAVVVVLLTLGLWLLTGREVRFSAEGVQLAWSARGGGRVIRWEDIEKIQGHRKQLLVRSREGRSFTVFCVFTDGYPRFAAALLERVNPAAFDPEALREIVEQHAKYRMEGSS